MRSAVAPIGVILLRRLALVTVIGTLACAYGAMGGVPPAAIAEAAPVAQSTNDKVREGARASDPPADESLRQIIDAALSDAARRTASDAGSLMVESAETVMWPDGSLGCPEPGVTYTMAPLPGYRIRIRSAERVLDYHASRRGSLVLCPPARSTGAVPGAAP